MRAGATELAQLFKNLGAPMSYEKVADVFMRYDKDESGQIEFGEFLLMFQVRPWGEGGWRGCLNWGWVPCCSMAHAAHEHSVMLSSLHLRHLGRVC